MTGGTTFMPGGFQLKTVMRMEVGRALAKSKAARTALEARLPAAEARAVEARLELERFEKRYATVSTT